MNRADRLYAVLADGKPHDRHSIFRHAGCFFLTNNAASELRARGFTVRQWRERDEFLYQLIDEGVLETPAPATGTCVKPSSADSRDDGNGAGASSAPSILAVSFAGDAHDDHPSGGGGGVLVLFDYGIYQ